ncbi:MAG: WD40/YVTN/BNR-like repeat-containing protein [Dissulfuribacterales bacterium]
MKIVARWCAAMILASVVLFAVSTVCVFAASGVIWPLERPAIEATKPAQCVLLGIASAGERLVAVGEFGRIILSDDFGVSWRQVPDVPVSVTLVAVSFATPQKGWAVGHYGVVLHSEDGGETWGKQLDGEKAALLILEAAQAKVDKCRSECDGAEFELSNAKLFVEDGPDKPFLNLSFDNENKGFIIGAYNLIFRTEDGGQSWEPWLDHVDNPMGMHLYDIQPIEGGYIMVGEQGTLLRSTDQGETFNSMTSPYVGSFFGAVSLSSQEVIIYELQGNAFKSIDRGATWKSLDTGLMAVVTGAEVLRDGTLILTGKTGDVLASRDKGSTFKPVPVETPFSFTDLVQAANGDVVIVGTRGVKVISRDTITANMQ